MDESAITCDRCGRKVQHRVGRELRTDLPHVRIIIERFDGHRQSLEGPFYLHGYQTLCLSCWTRISTMVQLHGEGYTLPEPTLHLPDAMETRYPTELDVSKAID